MKFSELILKAEQEQFRNRRFKGKGYTLITFDHEGNVSITGRVSLDDAFVEV